jgi:hypothetical protein
MLSDDAVWGGDETVDIGDLKSPERKLVWVRVPPALLYLILRIDEHPRIEQPVRIEGAFDCPK